MVLSHCRFQDHGQSKGAFQCVTVHGPEPHSCVYLKFYYYNKMPPFIESTVEQQCMFQKSYAKHNSAKPVITDFISEPPLYIEQFMLELAFH